ncbi:MAG: glycerol-3-phosphate 1-O-acyltransferase PlsY [Candidatus Zixiibacteriota bacterium]
MLIVDVAWIAGAILFGYLVGAIPFGLLVARAYGVTDVRSHGSGNIGATNVLRVAGARAAFWVYLLDIGKGVFAVMVARMIHQNAMPHELLLVLAGLSAVLGHVFPVYLKFHGGKGVNTGLGVMISVLPIETLICLAVFLIVLALTKFVSLGSMIAALALSAAVLIERFWLRPQTSLVFVGLSIMMTLVILLTHRGNLKRLMNGTENRFTLRSKSAGPKAGAHV